MFDLIQMINEQIVMSGADVRSSVVRIEEDPPSAVWHIHHEGREAVIMVQPTTVDDNAR